MDNNKEVTQEQLTNAEKDAIIKYEKGAKPYRPAKYKRVGTFITCQKCGSTRNLMKVVSEGKEFWFCKQCVMDRAIQIANSRRK